MRLLWWDLRGPPDIKEGVISDSMLLQCICFYVYLVVTCKNLEKRHNLLDFEDTVLLHASLILIEGVRRSEARRHLKR